MIHVGTIDQTVTFEVNLYNYNSGLYVVQNRCFTNWFVFHNCFNNTILQFKTYLKCSYFYFKFYIVRVLSICLGIKYQNEFK